MNGHENVSKVDIKGKESSPIDLDSSVESEENRELNQACVELENCISPIISNTSSAYGKKRLLDLSGNISDYITASQPKIIRNKHISDERTRLRTDRDARSSVSIDSSDSEDSISNIENIATPSNNTIESSALQWSSSNENQFNKPIHDERDADKSQKYDKLDLISFSNRAAVYKGVDRKTRRLVVIKNIEFDLDNGGIPSHIVREIGLMRQITNFKQEFLLSLKDIYFGPDQSRMSMVTIVMDYHHSNLETYVNSNIVTPIKAQINIFVQLTEAVEFLHNQNIIHRQITPTHILINPVSKSIKLTGFKLARPISQGGRMTPQMNEVCFYKSPELLLGATSYTNKVDVWSCGSILAFLYLQKSLFKGENNDALLRSVFKQTSTELEYSQFENILDCPPQIFDIILKMRNNEDNYFVPNVLRNHPVRNLMGQMLNINPTYRPEIEQIKITCEALSF